MPFENDLPPPPCPSILPPSLPKFQNFSRSVTTTVASCHLADSCSIATVYNHSSTLICISKKNIKVIRQWNGITVQILFKQIEFGFEFGFAHSQHERGTINCIHIALHTQCFNTMRLGCKPTLSPSPDSRTTWVPYAYALFLLKYHDKIHVLTCILRTKKQQ